MADISTNFIDEILFFSFVLLNGLHFVGDNVIM
jgi:hypothetical protein